MEFRGRGRGLSVLVCVPRGWWEEGASVYEFSGPGLQEGIRALMNENCDRFRHGWRPVQNFGWMMLRWCAGIVKAVGHWE